MLMEEEYKEPKHNIGTENVHIKKTKISNVKIGLLIIGILIGLAAGYALSGFGGTGTNLGDTNAVADKAMDYIKTNFLSTQGLDAKLTNAAEINGLYSLDFDVLQNNTVVQSASAYVSPDGQMLIFGQLFDMNKELPKPELPEEKPAKEVTKSDKPVVQLFVMSFCPYGIQAEKGIFPVIELLKDKIEFVPHFIVNVDNDSVGSLHGEKEANEDIRQACIWKYQKDKWWDYVLYVDNNLSLNDIDTKWKDAAEAAGVDTAKIETCAEDEGLDLMKAQEILSTAYGVSGSPTLIINEGTYNGGRDAEAYKQGICSAFNTAPAECNQTLESAAANASGNCG